MFGREPRSPGILNSTKEEGPDTSIVADITEEVVVERTAEVQGLHKKVMAKKRKHVLLIAPLLGRCRWGPVVTNLNLTLALPNRDDEIDIK